MRTTTLAALVLAGVWLGAAAFAAPVETRLLCSPEEALTPEQAAVGRAYDAMHPDSQPLIPGTINSETIDGGRLGPRPTLERQLAMRFCNASAIVSGTVKSRQFVLTPARKYIFGDYSFEIDEVFKRHGGIDVGATIRVIRPGGAVCTSAGRVAVERSGFSLLDVDKRYLLYLKYDPASGYSILDYGNYLLDGVVAADNTVTARSIETEAAKDSAELLTAVRGSSVTCAN